MTDLKNALLFLEKSKKKGSVLGLSRIYELLERLDNPQDKIKVIHISGTNGKGSFSSMLSEILIKVGFNVGSFSSPALTSVNDSFRIYGKTVDENLFSDILVKVINQAEKMSDSPTEFELLTAMAFLMFYEQKCDFALIECGLGGDTDSTNVIKQPFLSVITNVQKDHCNILGNSISEIAQHKSGIIKEKCPILYCGEKDEAYEVIKKKAHEMSAKLYLTNKGCLEVISSDISGTVLNSENYKNIRLSLLGLYQVENAINVLTAVDVMKHIGVNIPDSAVFDGLKNCKWQGRFEIIKKNPLVIFDGSHNPDGMRYTVKSIKEYFTKKPVLLMGVMADKEYYLYANMLYDVSEIIFTVTPDNSRSLDCEVLANYFIQNGMKAKACKSMKEAVKLAENYIKENKCPLIALGSLYMYKDFVEEIEKS